LTACRATKVGHRAFNFLLLLLSVIFSFTFLYFFSEKVINKFVLRFSVLPRIDVLVG